MRRLAIFFILCGACLSLTAGIAELHVGSSAEEVRAALGAPQGEMRRGDQLVWQYPAGTIKLVDGKVISIKTREATEDPPKRPAKAGTTQKVKEIRNNGARVELNALTEPGMVTIVDFFADWCGPCRQVSPLLQKMTAKHDGVILRKVDVVDWNRPVVQQYRIPSIPYIIVLDRRGNPVGSPTSDPRVVEGYVKQALKR